MLLIGSGRELASQDREPAAELDVGAAGGGASSGATEGALTA